MTVSGEGTPAKDQASAPHYKAAAPAVTEPVTCQSTSLHAPSAAAEVYSDEPTSGHQPVAKLKPAYEELPEEFPTEPVPGTSPSE